MVQNFTKASRQAVLEAAKETRDGQWQAVSVWHLAQAVSSVDGDARDIIKKLNQGAELIDDDWMKLAPAKGNTIKKQPVLNEVAKCAVNSAFGEAKMSPSCQRSRWLGLVGFGPKINTVALLIGCLAADEAIAGYFEARGVTMYNLRQELAKGVFES